MDDATEDPQNSLEILRRHISLSHELAEKVTDGEVATHLRQMAVEYQRIAKDIEAKAERRRRSLE